MCSLENRAAVHSVTKQLIDLLLLVCVSCLSLCIMRWVLGGCFLVCFSLWVLTSMHNYSIIPIKMASNYHIFILVWLLPCFKREVRKGFASSVRCSHFRHQWIICLINSFVWRKLKSCVDRCDCFPAWVSKSGSKRDATFVKYIWWLLSVFTQTLKIRHLTLCYSLSLLCGLFHWDISPPKKAVWSKPFHTI